MSDTPKLTAEARPVSGKGAARAARREGKVPAVIYGSNKNPTSITVVQKDLMKELQKGGFTAKLFEVDVDGKTERVIPRDVQFHPVTDWPLHVDFLRVSKNARIAVEVAVQFINEDACPGLKGGGVLNVVRHTIEVTAPATAIPEVIEVDLSGYEVGDSIHMSSVDLAEGVAPTITDRDFTIATVTAPSSLKSEESAADDEEGEGEEGEGGEEAAAEEGGEE